MGERTSSAALPDIAARRTALTALDRSLLVEAGAGSGKTSLIAGRVAFLLASGATPKNIAAITFTEFAASGRGPRLGCQQRQQHQDAEHGHRHGRAVQDAVVNHCALSVLEIAQ